jgi:hypothetical protein
LPNWIDRIILKTEEESTIARTGLWIPRWLFLSSLSCALMPALAQAPQPEVRIRSAPWYPGNLVISADANLVELVATVHDRHGNSTGGLYAADFEILDHNQPQAITLFSEQKAQAHDRAGSPATASAASSPAPPSDPRSIALFFDDAHASMLGVRKSAEAAARLLSDALPAGDLIGIFTSSGAVSVDYTRDRKLVLAALARLRARPLSGVHATTLCPTLGPSEAYIIARHVDLGIEDAAVGQAVGCNCPDPPPSACVFAQRGVVESAAQIVWQQYE